MNLIDTVSAAYAEDSHFEAATSAAVVAVDVAAGNLSAAASMPALLPATGPCADELYLAATADLDIAAVDDSRLGIVRVVAIVLHEIVAHAHAVVQIQGTWVLVIFYQKRQHLHFPHSQYCRCCCC